MPYKYLYVYLDKVKGEEKHFLKVGALVEAMKNRVPEITRDRIFDYFIRPKKVKSSKSKWTNWSQVRLDRVKIMTRYKLEPMKSFLVEELDNDPEFRKLYLRKLAIKEGS